LAMLLSDKLGVQVTGPAEKPRSPVAEAIHAQIRESIAESQTTSPQVTPPQTTPPPAAPTAG